MDIVEIVLASVLMIGMVMGVVILKYISDPPKSGYRPCKRHWPCENCGHCVRCNHLVPA